MRKAYNIIICDMRSSVFHFRRCVLRVSSQKVLLSCTFCSWLPNKSTIIPKKRGCILASSKYGIEIWGELLGTKQSFFETSSHGCGWSWNRYTEQHSCKGQSEPTCRCFKFRDEIGDVSFRSAVMNFDIPSEPRKWGVLRLWIRTHFRQ